MTVLFELLGIHDRLAAIVPRVCTAAADDDLLALEQAQLVERGAGSVQQSLKCVRRLVGVVLRPEQFNQLVLGDFARTEGNQIFKQVPLSN
jgi:hypothetical protein